jgi:hypothetical protein
MHYDVAVAVGRPWVLRSNQQLRRPGRRRLRCKPTPDFFYLRGSGPARCSRAGEGQPQAAAPIGAAALLRPGSSP